MPCHQALASYATAIVYYASLVKEDKTGKRVKQDLCTVMHGGYLFYIMQKWNLATWQRYKPIKNTLVDIYYIVPQTIVCIFAEMPSVDP